MNPILLNQLQALLPLLIAATTAVIVMLALAFTRRHGVILGITIFGLAAALASLALAMYVPAQTVPPLLRLDGFAHFVTGLLLVIGIAVALLSYSYLEMRTRMRGEYYLLLVLAIVGGIVLASSAHFVALFLGLEILSVSLFALSWCWRGWRPLSCSSALRCCMPSTAPWNSPRCGTPSSKMATIRMVKSDSS
jgi:NADH-quinone oxidoreductase subunit N